ncbi:hypothetical protein [Candidatus Hodgkinia cicadicola]
MNLNIDDKKRLQIVETTKSTRLLIFIITYGGCFIDDVNMGSDVG